MHMLAEKKSISTGFNAVADMKIWRFRKEKPAQ